jgi:hypothetical protein
VEVGFIYRNDEELLAAMDAVAGVPGHRAKLGENGYTAFVRWWCRKAHLNLYFEFLERIAVEKWGRIPWQTG